MSEDILQRPKAIDPRELSGQSESTTKSYDVMQDAFIKRGDIGWTVKQMQHGLKMRRRGWNGQRMHIAIQYPDLGSKMTQPYVYMYTADRELVPWLCSQTDLLAVDWEVATAD